MGDIELHGEFSHKFYRVEYRGFLVPNLDACDQGDGTWVLFLDGRWGTEPMSKTEMLDRIPFIADAQAIGAGYACHGAEQKHNPFRVRMMTIGAVSFGDNPPPPPSPPPLRLVRDRRT